MEQSQIGQAAAPFSNELTKWSQHLEKGVIVLSFDRTQVDETDAIQLRGVIMLSRKQLVAAVWQRLVMGSAWKL